MKEIRVNESFRPTLQLRYSARTSFRLSRSLQCRFDTTHNCAGSGAAGLMQAAVQVLQRTDQGAYQAPPPLILLEIAPRVANTIIQTDNRL